jgi:toxin ParE1/3/4
VNGRYVLRPKADDDLEQQAYYYSTEGTAETGHRFLVAAHETFVLLSIQPLLGWRVRLPHLRLAPLRVFRISGFKKMLVFYMPLSSGVEIVRVVHGSRNLAALLRRSGFEAVLKTTPPENGPPESPEFSHSGNGPILEYFRQNSNWNATEQEYEARSHPDLAEILFELAPDTAVRKGYVYGRPVIANRYGLILAWAGGTSDFFVRLSASDIATACIEGAQKDSTYPPEWANFYMVRLGPDWRKILQRWLTASYQQASDSH